MATVITSDDTYEDETRLSERAQRLHPEMALPAIFALTASRSRLRAA